MKKVAIPAVVDSRESLENSNVIIPEGTLVKIQGESIFRVGTGNKTWNELEDINSGTIIEDLSPQIDGIKVKFTLSGTYTKYSLYLNGLKQIEGKNFIIEENILTTLFDEAAEIGDELILEHW